MKTFLFVLVILLVTPLQASQNERFLEKIQLPNKMSVVVAEGDLEARSMGSFSLRLYEAASPQDATTFFLSRIIRPRGGELTKISLANINRDKQPELIVEIRSVGTGGYLSAQAFSFADNQAKLCATINDLPPTADPIAALRKNGTCRP